MTDAFIKYELIMKKYNFINIHFWIIALPAIFKSNSSFSAH